MNDLKPNGYKVFYYPNGNKMMEGNFKNGFKDGQFIFYNLDGKKTLTCFYNDGTIDKTVECFNSSEKKTVEYDYDSGSLHSSIEYLNEIIIGRYTYADANTVLNDSIPPVNSIYHAYGNENPMELFPGTVWTYVENSYVINENGEEKPVNVWLREPNFSTGPYIYNGDFSEYRSETGSLLRTGTYVRNDNDYKESVLEKESLVFREDGVTRMFALEYKQGERVNSLNFFDNMDREWKEVKLKNSKYTEGKYNIRDLGFRAEIKYLFDPQGNASLRFFK